MAGVTSSLAADAGRQFKSGYNEFASDASNRGYVKMLMALRFFRDAFRSRPDIVKPWWAHTNRIILGLWNTNDLMRQKHAVEHLCLVPSTLAAYLVSEALDTNCGWLKRAALFEARYIKDLQPGLGIRIAAYMSRLDDFAFSEYLKLLRTTFLLQSGKKIDRALVFSEALLRCALVAIFFISSVNGGNFAGSVMFGFIWLSIFWLGSGFAPSRWLPNSFSGVIAASVGWMTFWGIVKLILGIDKSLFDEDLADQILGCLLISFSGLLAMKVYFSDFRSKQFDYGLDADARALIDQLAMRQALSMNTLKTWALPLTLIVLMIFSVYSDLGKTIYGGVGVILVLLVASYMLFLFGAWLVKKSLEWVDFFALKRIRMPVSGRADIEVRLHQLKTPYGMSEYLRWLEAQPAGFSRPLCSPDDDWTDGVRPIFHEYYLNNYLAILDEQWRGLARR